MRIELIPDEVLEACQERGISESEIVELSAKSLFNEYCQWEGLINYGYDLWELICELKQVEEAGKAGGA